VFEFVVVAKNARLPDKEIAAIWERYEERSLLSEEDVSWQISLFGGKAVLLGRSRFEPQGLPVVSDTRGFTCLDGYLVSGCLRGGDVVAQLRRLLLDNPDRSWLSDCLGEFIVLHYDANQGVEFLCSELRTVPLYMREGSAPGVVCVSNRASLCNVGFDGKPTLDVLSQLDLIASGTMVGDGTAFKEVRVLPRDRSAHLSYQARDDRAGVPLLELPVRDWRWSQPLTQAPTMEEVVDHTAPVAEWMLEHLRLFSKQVDVAGGGEYGLSGGKDSRLMLALLWAAGLTDLYDGAYTFGLQADIEAAAPIAARYSLRHRTSPWSERPPGLFFPHLARHIFNTEGEVNCHDISGWDSRLRAGARGAPAVDVTGHEGSALRKDPYSRAELPRDSEDARRFIREGVLMDPAGLVRADALEAMRATILSQYELALEMGTKPENFLNLRKINQRLPRWTAKQAQSSSTVALQANFLCAPPIFVLAHNMGHGNREHDLIHLGLLAAHDPELLKYPFAEQQWSPEVMRVFGERYGLPDYSLKNPDEGQVRTGSWHQTVLKDSGRALSRTVSDLAHPDTRDLIDYSKLMDMLDGRALPPRSLISVTGVMTANLLLHAGDVTREGLSKMQAVVDIARENFDKPDSPPVYFARRLREEEEWEQCVRELREKLSVAMADKKLLSEKLKVAKEKHRVAKEKLKVAKEKHKVDKRRRIDQVERLQAVFDSRGWKILMFLHRIRKKLWPTR
jgi:hypothetical protein